MLELVTLLTPHVGVGYIINTLFWSWLHYKHLMLELVELLTPHVGVDHC